MILNDERARATVVLGYVALDELSAVISLEVLADFRVGLSFDEPEVAEKLAKAIEHAAIGDPARLDQHVRTLADHLDDSVLVRDHLCSALVAIGCESLDAAADAQAALLARNDGENPYWLADGSAMWPLVLTLG